ncbi:hypothetical protein [Streptomyces fagopyri]|uniref:hypothetical protein n=1 Tax=Streptomyces fagopyri TaxID=2662397 RepID=UPI0037FF6630
MSSRAEQFAVAQAGQPLPQDRVGYEQNGLELVDHLGAGPDRGILGELEHPSTLHRTVASLRPRLGTTTEHDPRGGLCVERV